MASAAVVLRPDSPTHGERVEALLGGRKVLRQALTLPLQLHRAAETGLAASVVEALSRNLELTRGAVLVALAMSPRTWTRRLESGRLSPEESDRALRLARVAAQAEEVLGDRAAAVRWLHQPSRGLGGHTPLELVRSDAGSQLVSSALGRLEHGVFG